MRWATLPLLLITPLGLFAQGRIAFIKFFGYQGIDCKPFAKPCPSAKAMRFDRRRSLLSSIHGAAHHRAKRNRHKRRLLLGRGNSTIFIGLPTLPAIPFRTIQPRKA